MRMMGKERLGKLVFVFRTKKEVTKRQLWQRVNNKRGSAEPIFLVGCGRSGTSMLVKRISLLYILDLFNEDHPDVFENWRLKSLSAIYDAIERSYARRIVFKPILDTPRTCQLLGEFPTAKVLFAFRHFSDVIQSSMLKFGPQNRLNHVNSWIEDNFSEFHTAIPPKATRSFIRSLWKPNLTQESGAALYWLFYNRLYFDMELVHEPRVRLVRYESVVTNPEEEFQEICSFLDLPYEPRMIEGIYSSSVKHDLSFKIDRDIRSACIELWDQMCQTLGKRARQPSSVS